MSNTDNRVRLGIIGVGHLGKIHLKCLQQTPFDVAGFFDTDTAVRSDILENFGIQSFKNVESLISACDAIDIVTPTTHHYDIARKAILSGKHVFIEKPVTNQIDQAEELIKLVKKNNVIAQVGHVERYNPAFQSLNTEKLNPRFIEAHRLTTFNPRGNDVSVILDLMIHDLDLILSLVNDEVKEIRANGVNVVGDTPDICNARISFDNGCVANVTASRISMKNMRKIRFFQENAYISVDFLDKDCQIIQLEDLSAEENNEETLMTIDTKRGKRKVKIVMPEIHENNAIVEELNDFYDCILHHKTPTVGIVDGYRALKLAAEIENVVKQMNQ